MSYRAAIAPPAFARPAFAPLAFALVSIACGRSSLYSARCDPALSSCPVAGTGGAAGRGAGGNGGAGGAVTCAEMREICGNGKDDNCNGLADCNDPGCFGDRSCS